MYKFMHFVGENIFPTFFVFHTREHNRICKCRLKIQVWIGRQIKYNKCKRTNQLQHINKNEHEWNVKCEIENRTKWNERKSWNEKKRDMFIVPVARSQCKCQNDLANVWRAHVFAFEFEYETALASHWAHEAYRIHRLTAPYNTHAHKHSDSYQLRNSIWLSSFVCESAKAEIRIYFFGTRKLRNRCEREHFQCG